MTYDHDDIKGWMEKWNSVLQKGTFDVPNPQNLEINNEEEVSIIYEKSDPLEPDAKYWEDMKELRKQYGSDSQYLNDYFKTKMFINEEVAVDTKKYTKAMTSTPNPIKPASVGMDQDLNPISLGNTYDVADLEKLDTLKVKLHDLLVKLSSNEGRSQPGSPKLESQIQELQKQVDELSDCLNKSVPAQQGD